MPDKRDPLDRRNLTFAQAEGVDPLPEPLKLGEISDELRALLWSVFYDDLNRHKRHVNYQGNAIGGPWLNVLRDLHVLVGFQMADEFGDDFDRHCQTIKQIITTGSYIVVFDYVQHVLRHQYAPYELDEGVAWALKRARAAYMLIDGNTIYPKASEEEGAAIKRAFADLAKYELNGARAHLRAAGEELNRGQYADSIRESIHAVEAVARILDPGASTTLEPALAVLVNKGALHPALKRGFAAIYGYTSDEKGVRHSLVYEPQAQVDITDAVFMIGACASFISYLVAKATAAGIDVEAGG